MVQILCLKATVDANKHLNNGAVYFDHTVGKMGTSF